MRMVQCQNGHFYDQEKSSTCPYCSGLPSSNAGVTVGMPSDIGSTVGMPSDIGATVGMPSDENYFDYNIDKTMALDASMAADDDDDGKTVAIFQQKLSSKIDPVVGWLVCINGDNKGVDFKIHSDNNFIGRNRNMDICINFDSTISRENHAIISYDAKYNKFYFSPGEGRAIVRVNQQSVFTTVELSDYDVIEIGETELVFVSLCGEKFKWDK